MNQPVMAGGQWFVDLIAHHNRQHIDSQRQ
jgi:hypothetical protein